MTPIGLPVRYHEASAMLAAFPVPTERLAALTPEALRVVELWPGRAPLVIACFDYLGTSLGPYGEVGVCWPAVPRGRFPTPPLVPLLFEDRWPGLRFWIHHLPVTTPIARDGGVALWGYPKFLASIEYDWDGATRTCILAERGETILRLSIDTWMPARPTRFRVRTWSRLGDELLGTTIRVDAVGLRRPGGRGSLTLGAHPIGRELAELGPGPRPIEVRWFPVWRAILPGADVRIAARPPARSSRGRDRAPDVRVPA